MRVILNEPFFKLRKFPKTQVRKVLEYTRKRNSIVKRLADPTLDLESKLKLRRRKFLLDKRIMPDSPERVQLRKDLKKMLKPLDPVRELYAIGTHT